MRKDEEMFIVNLKNSIEDEYKSYHLYKSMYELTNDPMWKDFIKHAYEDEKSHYEMLQQLHYMLTGQFVPNPRKPLPCFDLKACAKQAIADELEAVETYKIMLLTVPNQQAYNPIFIAMQDEMEHAIRFSTIYNAL